MASPNYDAIHVRLSRMLGDPVASAATNGKVWSSVRRDILLNASVRRLMLENAERKNWNFFSEMIAEESEALTNNVVALSSFTGGVFEILSVYNSTDSLKVYRLPEEYRYSPNAYYTPSTTNQFWVKDGANFRLLDAGTTTSDTVALRYVKLHTDMTAAFATDIPIPSTYWNILLDYALELGVQEKPDPEKYPVVQDKTQEKVPITVISDR